MKIISPVFQFEIRFTPLIGFQNIIHEAVVPYSNLYSNASVSNELTKDIRFTLEFPETQHKIIIGWDRLVLRYEGIIERLGDANSIVDEPFFSLFERIKNLSQFGKVTSFLCYSILIKKIENNKEAIVENFTNRYYSSAFKQIDNEWNDVAFILEKHTGEKNVSIQHGPYLGLDDLDKRKSLPNYLDLKLFDFFGEMVEMRIWGNTQEMDFNFFKKRLQETKAYQKKLWPTD